MKSTRKTLQTIIKIDLIPISSKVQKIVYKQVKKIIITSDYFQVQINNSMIIIMILLTIIDQKIHLQGPMGFSALRIIKVRSQKIFHIR